MTARRRIVASGVLVAGAYVVAVAISGQLSPLARRPLLDGMAPPAPYRWVDPPAALAADNLPPTAGSFRVPLGAAGSATEVFTTEDAQVTLILAEGAFVAAARADAVRLEVTPVAPSDVGPPPPPLEIVGNAVRIDATYEPSGEGIDEVAADLRVVLVYPFEPNQHGGHTIVTSTDGQTWTAAETNDLPSIQQADALVTSLGYVAVAIEPGVSPRAAPETDVATGPAIAIGIGLVVLVAITVFLLRPRR